MAIKIIVPSLGESVTEATIAKWHKKPGEYAKVDELILELETEKVTLEVNASASGIISSILASEGANVNVGQEIGEIDESAKAEIGSIISIEQPKTITPISPTVIASPSASKIASENSLNLADVSGSGKAGRLTKSDVLSAVSAPKLEVKQSAEDRVHRVKMSRLRKKIAERLKDSQNTAAILTTFNEIDMFNVIALRNKYKELFEKKYEVKLGFMSFFVKAVIHALKEVPAVNAEIDNDDLVYKNYYDISVAVGTEQGLVVPVIRDADKMNFSDIEKKIGEYGKKAREGKLSMEEMMGGTFTISNGGVYGSLLSTPIINPPQSGILGMHKTQERAVVINGKVEIRPMMYIALSYDHRIIDGKEAVTFLIKVKEAIENPDRMLLDL